MIDPLLLSAAPITTYAGSAVLTNATGFFFRREGRLFLVTSRHVLRDEAGGHFPDSIGIEVHDDPDNLAAASTSSMPLYRDGQAIWRQGVDDAGDVDVALLPIADRDLPPGTIYHPFTPAHLQEPGAVVEVGSPLLIVGFPLGFGDTLHHMPVARHGIIASSFGLRFKGQGYFLTDARTHRGSSGSPVVMRLDPPLATLGELQWMLLGVHSARLDLATRDLALDEALGLNCAWYADILMTLSEP